MATECIYSIFFIYISRQHVHSKTWLGKIMISSVQTQHGTHGEKEKNHEVQYIGLITANKQMTGMTDSYGAKSRTAYRPIPLQDPVPAFVFKLRMQFTSRPTSHNNDISGYPARFERYFAKEEEVWPRPLTLQSASERVNILSFSPD